MKNLILLVALSFGAGACTHEKALIVSGEALDAVGVQFQSTGKAMVEELDRQGLTAEKCAVEPEPAPYCTTFRKWAAFARKFKVAYPSAVAVWKAAEESQDDKLLAQVGAIGASLGAELAAFAGGGR